MKRSRFAVLLGCAAMVMFLTSCGGNDDSNKSTTDTSANTTTKPTEPAPKASTIVTTPENMIVVVHKVANYAKWQASYDAHDSARLANGLHNYVIARGFTDSNMVMVALKADDLAKAKSFASSPGLKAAMQKGGVVGAPSASFVTEVWQDTATLAPGTLRSRTMFTVKDWDVFFKSFQDGKQERMDNGIVDRVIGHDADDNKKVTLVTAVLDSAKAFAYYKSDALKKRRAAGGLVDEPKRFLFQIVKKY